MVDAIFYVVFGSGEEQEWNRYGITEDTEKAKTSIENNTGQMSLAETERQVVKRSTHKDSSDGGSDPKYDAYVIETNHRGGYTNKAFVSDKGKIK